MDNIGPIAARILRDIGHARSLGQLERIDNSPQSRALKGDDAAAVAAAASDRLLAVTDDTPNVWLHIDRDLPVPEGGA